MNSQGTVGMARLADELAAKLDRETVAAEDIYGSVDLLLKGSCGCTSALRSRRH
ncbi:hypothetical protein [Streptomyces sp. x-19]|uniref:hypothetical protein n=1 Tax=Streptomyces sp. x-19 TaxID=2789280 RepID=UPI00397EEB32